MINILHLDTEGGWGGSSISLFNIVTNLNRKRFKPFVICRKNGPIIEKYKKKNINIYKNLNLYSFSPKPRTNNFKLFLTTIPQFIFFINGLIKLYQFINKNKIDIVHLNFEGFFLVGIFLNFFFKIPIVIHYRSTIPTKSISHKIISIINLFLSKNIIFISKIEKKKFLKIYPFLRKIKPHVVYNISKCKNLKFNRFKNKDLIYIGNISFNKGVDRLIDLAQYLQKHKIKSLIKIYGDTRGEKSYKDKIIKKIKELKLNNIKLMGRTKNPEEIIQKAFLILRPSRHNDPWGRDIIDACSAGIPCISTGNENDIIINKINSYYVKNFDSKKVSEIIKDLSNSNRLYNKISKNFLKQRKLLLSKEKSILKLQNLFLKLYN